MIQIPAAGSGHDQGKLGLEPATWTDPNMFFGIEALHTLWMLWQT